jgi:hypothetical protein
MQDANGQKLECIVSNYTPVGAAYVIEFRCLSEGSFLDQWPAPPQSGEAGSSTVSSAGDE